MSLMTMSKRRALKPPKPLAGDYADEALYAELAHAHGYQAVEGGVNVSLRTLTGGIVPSELVAYLMADKAPRSNCAHCGTVRAALLAYHSDTCSCLCHAVRRRDAAVRAARRVGSTSP